MASNAELPDRRHGRRRTWFHAQFHPEVTHTKQGTAILRRFVLDICEGQADVDDEGPIIEKPWKPSANKGNEEVILAFRWCRFRKCWWLRSSTVRD